MFVISTRKWYGYKKALSWRLSGSSSDYLITVLTATNNRSSLLHYGGSAAVTMDGPIVGTYLNPLAPGRCGMNIESVLFEQMMRIKSLSTSCEIALRWIRQNAFNDKSSCNGLVPSGTNPLPKPLLIKPNGVTRPHWVKMWLHIHTPHGIYTLVSWYIFHWTQNEDRI